MIWSGFANLVTNIYEKIQYHSVQLRMECHFQLKPDFFDLNELKCRLLAPRLAFQKLTCMQAPRGNQFKIIKRNVVNIIINNKPLFTLGSVYSTSASGAEQTLKQISQIELNIC